MRMPGFDLICRLIESALVDAAPPPSLLERVRAAAVVRPRALVDLAHAHLVTPAMAVAVEDLGIGDRLPDRVRACLAAVRALSVAHNRELRSLLHDAARRLNRIDVVPVPLDGTIRLIDDLHPDPAFRLTPDLDLLVPAERLADAARALAAAGWLRAPAEGCRDARRQMLVHPDAEACLKLRATPLDATGDRLLPAAAVLMRARFHPLGDAALLLPAPEHQLVHLAACSTARRGGRFALRDTVELALLARRFGPGRLAAAGTAFAAAGRRSAWGASLALARLCLPRLAPAGPGGASLLDGLLARRMVLKQGAPALLKGRGGGPVPPRSRHLALLLEPARLF
jgi:hypothetical protein